MNILFTIVENNHQELNIYYAYHDPTYKELLLSFTNYLQNPHTDTLKTLLLVWHSYDNMELDASDRNNFYTATWFKVGIRPEFLQQMQHHPGFRQFIADHLGEIRLELQLSANHDDAQSMQQQKLVKEILSTITPSSPQKPFGVYKLYPNNYRVFQLYNVADESVQNNVDIDLHIQTLLMCKYHQLDLKHSNLIFNHAKTFRQNFIEESIKNNHYSILLWSLHQDIPNMIIKNYRDNKPIIPTHELWTDIPRYTLDNIDCQELPLIDVPFKKDNIYIGQKARMALYVIMPDDTLILGIDHTYGHTDRSVHHAALANGQNVKAGGIILFSEDMKEIIAINNATGHYHTDIPSCKLLEEKLEHSHFNKQHMEVCSVNWFRINSKPTDLSTMKKMIKNIKA